MKKRLLKIWHYGRVAMLIIILTALIGFVEKKQGKRLCKAIEVNIDNQYQNYFINESDVIEIITDRGGRKVVGKPFGELNLKEMELALKEDKFVEDAEVYKDLNGNLIISIEQSRPIARLMSKKMSGRYISEKGDVLPLSKRFTPRVVLIDGAFADNTTLYHLYETELGRQVMDLLKFIKRDKFWRAQIAQMRIDKKGNIKMYTQVSKQVVDFGKPEDIEEKFRKLKIFYKKILPAKGWNSYNSVSVKFKNQIICE